MVKISRFRGIELSVRENFGWKKFIHTFNQKYSMFRVTHEIKIYPPSFQENAFNHERYRFLITRIRWLLKDQ